MGTINLKLLEAAIIAKATREPVFFKYFINEVYDYLDLLGLTGNDSIALYERKCTELILMLAGKEVLHIDYIGARVAYVRLHHDYKT